MIGVLVFEGGIIISAEGGGRRGGGGGRRGAQGIGASIHMWHMVWGCAWPSNRS